MREENGRDLDVAVDDRALGKARFVAITTQGENRSMARAYSTASLLQPIMAIRFPWTRSASPSLQKNMRLPNGERFPVIEDQNPAQGRSEINRGRQAGEIASDDNNLPPIRAARFVPHSVPTGSDGGAATIEKMLRKKRLGRRQKQGLF